MPSIELIYERRCALDFPHRLSRSQSRTIPTINEAQNESEATKWNIHTDIYKHAITVYNLCSRKMLKDASKYIQYIYSLYRNYYYEWGSSARSSDTISLSKNWKRKTLLIQLKSATTTAQNDTKKKKYCKAYRWVLDAAERQTNECRSAIG